MKNYLIILRSSLLATSYPEEVIELILVLASLNYPVAVVFYANANLGMILNSQSQSLYPKLTTAIRALKLFELDNLYYLADEAAAINQSNQLAALAQHFPNLVRIDVAKLAQLASSHQLVFSF